MQGSSRKILQLLETRTVLRPADLEDLDIPRITLYRLHQRGQVLKVALKALTDCRRRRLCKGDALWLFAKICRVSDVIRPYLEAMNA